MAQTDLFDTALKLAGILVTCMALGSGLAITMAVLEEKTLSEIELWGFVGTAIGFLLGLLCLICALMIIGPA